MLISLYRCSWVESSDIKDGFKITLLFYCMFLSCFFGNYNVLQPIDLVYFKANFFAPRFFTNLQLKICCLLSNKLNCIFELPVFVIFNPSEVFFFVVWKSIFRLTLTFFSSQLHSSPFLVTVIPFLATIPPSLSLSGLFASVADKFNIKRTEDLRQLDWWKQSE